MIKTGDILCGSNISGYDTYAYFYLVVKRTPKTVVLQELCVLRTRTGDWTFTCMPDELNAKGKPFRVHIYTNEDDSEVVFTGVNTAAKLWNGEPAYEEYGRN
jgi:hypothetical protein